MLTERQAAILDFIIGQYVTSATPVPSSSIAQKRTLNVSPATIRNEMAELEDEGYILRKHVSGGGIPSDKGYRFFVDTLPARPTLSDEERQQVLARFEAMKRDLELGTRMMTDLLSMLVRNVAIATMPKANQTRIRRVDLVAVQEALTLVVLVLQEARTRQRILRLAESLTQDQLTTISNKLTATYGGATRHNLKAQASDLTPVERQVLEATSQIMEDEDASRFEEPTLSGMKHLLNQPEFQANPRLRALIELLEDKAALKDILPKILAGEEFRAVIGDDNPQDEMQECSVIISRYGQTDGVGGLIAVIGPTRMEYRKSIGSVRLLSALMSEMVKQVN